MHKEIEQYLSHLYPLLLQRGIDISSSKEIAYGFQLKVCRNGDRATINIYYGEKRGLSQVISATKASSLKHELELLMAPEKEPQIFAGFHNWQSWIGSDECGKGDYFGPLVGSAFFATADQVPCLKKLGVQDSKHLGDARIVQIAKKLYLNFPNQTSCLVLNPKRYNELIAGFKAQRLNLNDLLAWIHEKVILELYARQSTAQGVVVDQFSKSQKVRARLAKREAVLNTVERPGGERDIAVAAASILARYQFLEARARLERIYKFSFPKGANPQVIKAAREFLKVWDQKHLGEVAKLHFKTTAHVMGSSGQMPL
jgi:ribonuclease HIII